MFDILLQAVIMTNTAAAIFLCGRPESWSRWGCLVGLIGQPFWFISLFRVEPLQWGWLVSAILITGSYLQGCWFKLLKPYLAARRKTTGFASA